MCTYRCIRTKKKEEENLFKNLFSKNLRLESLNINRIRFRSFFQKLTGCHIVQFFKSSIKG